jgi:hypothetical protein
VFDLLAPLAADRAGKPPTLSSLADEERVGSLLRSTAARDPLFIARFALLQYSRDTGPRFPTLAAVRAEP